MDVEGMVQSHLHVVSRLFHKIVIPIFKWRNWGTESVTCSVMHSNGKTEFIPRHLASKIYILN